MNVNPEPITDRYRNVYGRKGGRGVRPYLITLKLLSVATLFGSLVSVLALALLVPVPTTPRGWSEQAELIRRAYLCVLLPGLIGATGVGLLLAASIWRVMIRMRWFLAKMLLIAACGPGLHLFLRSRWFILDAAVKADPADISSATAARSQMLIGMLAAVALLIAVIILGRIKPRLGQDYARSFSRSR